MCPKNKKQLDKILNNINNINPKITLILNKTTTLNLTIDLPQTPAPRRAALPGSRT